MGGAALTPTTQTNRYLLMAHLKRPSQASAWMDGFRYPHTVEAAALALERRLRHREGLLDVFPDAVARLPFSEIDQWSD